MKGITPVIALVMLMLITVGMVGIAYSWFSGLLSTQTEKGISIPPGGSYCVAGLISVLIQNNGASSDISKNDLIIVQVDGTDVPYVADTLPANGVLAGDGKTLLGDGSDYPLITSGSGGVFVRNYDCNIAVAGNPSAPTTTCASGSHSVRVGTRTGVVESTAYCK
ncbi:MAG: hypothetical protein HYT71_00395 [Candidatus Aenigmarchaeota archaeon]|nr:hypothetical protein [Candidatus Aenigmarchaeota archaeon]